MTQQSAQPNKLAVGMIHLTPILAFPLRGKGKMNGNLGGRNKMNDNCSPKQMEVSADEDKK